MPLWLLYLLILREISEICVKKIFVSLCLSGYFHPYNLCVLCALCVSKNQWNQRNQRLKILPVFLPLWQNPNCLYLNFYLKKASKEVKKRSKIVKKQQKVLKKVKKTQKNTHFLLFFYGSTMSWMGFWAKNAHRFFSSLNVK